MPSTTRTREVMPPPAGIAPMPTQHRCAHCSRVFIGEPTYGPSNGTRRTILCQSCYNEYCFVCHLCGEVQYRGDSYRFIDDEGTSQRVCSRCHVNHSTWDKGDFSVAECHYDQIRSQRKFGLELETHSCPHYRRLRGNTPFGAKFDCSVGGMEFVSPILGGDEGLAAVEEFCAKAAELNFTVGEDCGFHLHMDMRDECTSALKSAAYAYLKTDAVWRLLVNNFRANNCGYCRVPEWTLRDLERADDMELWCDRWNRYALCNLQAYPKFGSYEIRLYQGTLDAKEINNWIKAHLRFTDWACTKDYTEIDDAFGGSAASKWESLKAIFGDIHLNRTYGRIRRERLGITPRARATVSS